MPDVRLLSGVNMSQTEWNRHKMRPILPIPKIHSTKTECALRAPLSSSCGGLVAFGMQRTSAGARKKAFDRALMYKTISAQPGRLY
jgi:hypothetical protein